MTDGAVIARRPLRDGMRPMGNLAMSNGMLISLDSMGVTCFERRDIVEKEIQTQKEAHPLDYTALMREADIASLKQNYRLAVASLRSIPVQGLSPERVDRRRSKLIENLTALILSDSQEFDPEMQELSSLAATPDEKSLASRLAAKRFEDRQEFEQAFQIYMLLASSSSDEKIPRADNPRIRVCEAEWIAGKLLDTWNAAPAAARNSLSAQISAEADKALSSDVEARVRFVRCFGFHPAALPVLESLVEHYAAAGDFLKAEALLLRMSNNASPEVAANALSRLGRLLVEFGLPHDAASIYADLAHRFPEVKLSSGVTSREHVAKLGQDDASLFEQLPAIAWKNVDLRLESSGTSYNNDIAVELQASGRRLPFFQNLRMQVHQHQERLCLINARDESMYWMLPLRQSMGRSHGAFVLAQITGHQLIFLFQDVLYCLSPVERKVLWTLPVDRRGQVSSYYRTSPRNQPPRFLTGTKIAFQFGLAQTTTPGMLAVANGNYVCVYGRRSFSVFDATTGAALWECRGVAKNTRIYGTDDVIYVVPQVRNQSVALRARDGKKLAVEDVSTQIANSIATCGNGLVQVDVDRRRESVGLSRRDPVTRTEFWSRKIPPNVSVAAMDDESLAILDPSKGLSLLDLETGREREFKFDAALDTAMSPFTSSSEVYCFSDPYAVYLVSSKRRQQQHHLNQVASVPLNGAIYSFDRRTGKQLWKTDVDDMALLTTYFDYCPMLVLMAQKNQTDGNSWYQTVTISAIDKSTGRRYLDSTQPVVNGLQTFELNMADRFLELRMFDNRRYRLLATDHVAENDPVAAPKPRSASSPRADQPIVAPPPPAQVN
jgi:outer membrane protein assembly factor BamB